jgi:hypothetical protein
VRGRLSTRPREKRSKGKNSELPRQRQLDGGPGAGAVLERDVDGRSPVGDADQARQEEPLRDPPTDADVQLLTVRSMGQLLQWSRATPAVELVGPQGSGSAAPATAANPNKMSVTRAAGMRVVLVARLLSNAAG